MKRILLLSALVTSVCSCIEKPGCSDYAAVNYDPLAETFDNSCYYAYDLSIFWHSNTYNNMLQDSGSVTLSAYLDDVFIGSLAADKYVGSNYNCGAGGGIQYKGFLYYDYDLGHLVIKDQAGKIMADETLQLYPGCNEYDLN
jgi:hypothetical protein